MPSKVEFTFSQALSAEDLIGAIERVLREVLRCDNSFPSAVGAGALDFEIRTSSGEVATFALLARFEIYVLLIRNIEAISTAIALADSIALETDFLLGWIADQSYESVENETDLEQLSRLGKDVRDVPRTHDTVWGDEIADTSRNPGRRVIRRGYVEAVGAIMWLRRDRLRSAEKAGLECFDSLELAPDVFRVHFAADLFRAPADTDGALVQERIRSCLFPLKL